MRNALLLALGSIMLAGWMLAEHKPAVHLIEKEADAGAHSVITVGAQNKTDKQRRIDNYLAGTTEIDRAGDGHFYTDIEANGAKISAVVDTGASVIALTASDARAAGLTWSPADIRVIGTGASGPVKGVPVTLSHVALGGHEADNVPAVIIPEGLQMSLLGQSFLSTIDPVRIEGNRLLLGG